MDPYFIFLCNKAILLSDVVSLSLQGITKIMFMVKIYNSCCSEDVGKSC